MPADSGRKKAPEWDEVDIVENDKQKAACKACNQIINAKIERVRTHIRKCSKRRDHFRGKAGELLIIVSRPTVLSTSSHSGAFFLPLSAGNMTFFSQCSQNKGQGETESSIHQ